MRLRVVSLSVGLAVSVLLSAGCAVPSLNPDGSVPQNSPLGFNGLFEEPDPAGKRIWGADLVGSQLLRFDPDTGVISERYSGLCGVDDVVVMPDDSLVATCPSSGQVIRFPRGGGALQLLANVGAGVNPIALDPSGTAVLVGFGTDEGHTLLRVHLDGSPVEVVADGLPALNGFGFGPDGLLYVPTGGVGGLLGGTGGLATIDVSTGAFTPIPLTFDDPAKKGFGFAIGVDVAADGTVYVGQGFSPEVYAVDPHTGHATLVGAAPMSLADNVLVLSDGRVVMSGFLGGDYTVFTPEGSGGWTTSVGHVGS